MNDYAQQLSRLQQDAQRLSQRQHNADEAALHTHQVAELHVWAMLLNCMEHNEVFCARDDDENKLVIFVDDGSEVTLIRRGAVLKHWETHQGTKINIHGVGTDKKGTGAQSMVSIPLKLRCAMDTVHMTGYIVPDNALPDGVDVLVGKPIIKSMGIKPDSRNMRLELTEVRSSKGIPTVINTMPLEKQLDIFDSEPLRILDICGGGSFSYQTLTDMGYDIQLYDAIEKDPMARGIARWHSKNGVTHLAPHDLMKLSAVLPDTYTDIIATPECAPWSGASHAPKGFKDKRARLFEKAADIIQDQRQRNPGLNVLFENTLIHESLVGDAEQQETLVGGKFEASNACDLGGMSSRPRRIHSNMADASHLVSREPAPSRYALQPGWLPVKHPMFCLLSKRDTWNPQVCISRDAIKKVIQGKGTIAEFESNGKLRELHGDERDAYMGHVPGISARHMDEDNVLTAVTEDYRRELMGKGLHEAHVWAYFFHRKNVPHTVARTMMTLTSMATPDQFELFLSDFESSSARQAWFREHTMASYKMLQLTLEMNEANGPVQVTHNYGTGSKLDASMTHALELLCKDGRIEEVIWDKDYWVVPCFPKEKVGRTFPDCDLALVRPLCDLRSTNEHIKDTHQAWMVHNPTREGIAMQIPQGTKWFGEIDLQDAFHWGQMHPDSQRFVVIHWKGRWFKFIGVPQGLRPASNYFSAMVVHLLNTALGGSGAGAAAGPAGPDGELTPGEHGGGAAWNVGKWFLGWIDDYMPIGPTYQRCLNRQLILLDVFAVANLPISPKCKGTVSEKGKLIGMYWTEVGHCLDDAAVESLSNTLLLRPKTKSEGKQIIGVINYSDTAFQYSPTELSVHAQHMATLNAAISGDKLQWTAECDEAMEQLRIRMKVQTRKMYDPVDLLDDDHCLVIMGDAAETGVGAGLFLVKRGSADDVVVSDITADGTILVDAFHKVLNTGQKKWQVFELEAYVMFLAVQKWSKYISRALYKRATWTGNKIALLTDSTTACAKWYSLHIPEYEIKHLCAKGRRFLGWADKIAYSANWPMTTAHVEGELNSLAHMLSHVGDILSMMGKHTAISMTAQQAADTIGAHLCGQGTQDCSVSTNVPTVPTDVAAMTITLHTCHGPPPSAGIKTFCCLATCMVTPETTCMATLHSYHGPRPTVCDENFSDPPNFTVRHLHLDAAGTEALADAYSADGQKFHKLQMRTVYAVATGNTDGLEPLVKDQVNAWMGKQIFAIMPPKGDRPLLYTPASTSMVRWGDPAVLDKDEQLHKVLVPMIPMDVQAKLTSLEPIVEGGTTKYDEMHRDLRHDIMVMAHAFQQPHAGRAATMHAVRQMAYWPSAEEDVKRFCDSCAECLSHRKPAIRAGSTMTSTRRFGVIVIDKIIFDDDVAALVGMPGALLMTCVVVADSQYAMCYSMTAVEAARLIYVHAIPQYSIPMAIVSDSEPAFAAQVTQELAKMFGVRTWDFGPVSSPQHHAKVERRVAPYKRAIENAMSSGTIKCWRTMEVVLASTLITQTQLTVTYGTTAFTRRTGAVPRTHRELFSSPYQPNFELTATNEADTAVLHALQFHVKELSDWHQEMRDWAHRKALYPKLVDAAKKMRTDFFLIPGDMVSYCAERYLLLEVTGAPNQPMTAVIQRATHADAVIEKTVRYDTLTPLAAMREKLLYDLELNVQVGDFIFFLTPMPDHNGPSARMVICGKVLASEDDKYSVHIHDPSPQHKCYMPSWQRTGNKDKSQKAKPKGFQPEVTVVPLADVEYATQLTAQYTIPMQAWKAMQARGVVLPFEYTAPDTPKKSVTFAHTSAVTTHPRRAPRRSRLRLAHDGPDHRWVKATLLHLGLKVCNDVLFDHGRLLHYVVRGSTSMPSGAMMDEDYLKIMHDMGADDTGNAVPQLRMRMMGMPERDTLHHADHMLTPDNAPEPTAPIWDCTEPISDVTAHSANTDWAIAPMFQPTAPEWYHQWDSPMPIQCPTTDSYTRSRLTILLASIGMLTLIVCTLLLCAATWMAAQGYAITGLWLTITPTYDNGPDGQQGYQRLQ